MVETIQTYILMHKDIPVAKIRLDSVTASVSAVGEIWLAPLEGWAVSRLRAAMTNRLS